LAGRACWFSFPINQKLHFDKPEPGGRFRRSDNTLEQHRNNLTKTAERLKITRHALRYRMTRLNIQVDTLVDEDSAPASGKEASPC